MDAIQLINGQESICFGYACKKCKEVFRGDEAKEKADLCCTPKGHCPDCNKVSEIIKNPFYGFDYDEECKIDKHENVCSACITRYKQKSILFFEREYKSLGKRKGDKFIFFEEQDYDDEIEHSFSSIKKLLEFAFDKKVYFPRFGVQRCGKDKEIGIKVDDFLDKLLDEELKKERKEVKRVIVEWYRKLPVHQTDFESLNDEMDY